MSDLHIPQPQFSQHGGAPRQATYRAARPAVDTGTRRLLYAAAGLGGVLLAGMGVWAVVGRTPAVVPVIEADGRPLRVKPDNPGGMQVTGAEEAPTGPGRMAPAAEVPAPQALRAQLAPPAAPALAAAPVPAAPAPATPVAAAPAPRPATPLPASAAAPRPAQPGSATLVQLAAVDTEAAAQAEWQRLARRMPDLLGDKRVVVQRTERDGKTLWRVRTGGFTDMADATGFCTKVRAKGGNCSIASF